MLHHKNIYRTLFGILSIWRLSAMLHAGEFLLDLKDPKIRAAIEQQGGEVVRDGPEGDLAIKIVSTAGPGSASTEAEKYVVLPFDLSSFKGTNIEISGKVRGEKITKPLHDYTGVKVQLHVLAADDKQNWIDQGGTYGTFDWKTLSARAGIPQDATSATLTLGMQECTGTVWIRDVKVRSFGGAGNAPAPEPSAQTPAVEVKNEQPEGGAKQADQKRILFFGNSITLHPPNKEVDWPNNWGMAASAESKDYVHLVVAALSHSSGNKIDFMIKNGVPFEAGFETYNLNDLNAALRYNADIVVIAIGENANSLTTQEKKDTFEEKLNEIVRAFKQAGNPKIIIRSTFWGQTERDEILKRVAMKHGCIYVDLSRLVYDENNYARAERDYTHEGVGIHPGDKGMQNIADAILDALKTDPSLFQGEEFRLDLNSPDVRSAIEKQGAEIVAGGPGGKAAIKIVSTAEEGASSSASNALVILPVDVAPYKGAKIEISGQVRGENITKPGHVYTGVKVQLHVMTAGGQQNWIDQGGTHGTFDWKELSARSGIPQDANEAFLTLGMQECTGTVWISDVVIRFIEKAKVRPAPKDVKVTTQLRGVMSPLEVDPQDFQDMKAWNINLVRWQMFGVPEHLADYEGWFARQLVKIEQALDQAEANDIGIIIDFHYLPGGREDNGDSRLFYDKKLQEDFIGYWEAIATRFKDHPALYAYDLMNEPVQRSESPEGVDNWYDLQVRTAKAIREIDPETFITIESDDWCNPSGYLTLDPLELPGIIYQVHSYWPGGFTHQGIFTDQGIAKDVDSKESAVSYPGMMNGQWVDKEALRKQLQPVRDFQLAYDVPIYAGEFSVVRWAPGGAQFLDDLISIFEEYGWDWTYHVFREYGGWSVEHENLPYDRDHHVKATEPTDRQEVLMKWFKLNQPYEMPETEVSPLSKP